MSEEGLSIVEKYLIWLSINVIGLIIIKLSQYPIPCGNLPEDSAWRKWITFHQNPDTGKTYFQLYFFNLSPFQRVNNYKEIIVATSIMFYYGNVYHKYQSVSDFYYIFGFLFAPIFGAIMMIKGMDFTISPDSLKNLSKQAKITLIVLSLIITSLLSYHLYLAHLDGILAPYLAAMLIIPILYLYWYWKFLKEQPNYTASWHIHHWFIGFYFSLLWRFNDPISKIAFSFFYPVFLQGAYFYGFMAIIYVTHQHSTLQYDIDDIFYSNDSDYL